jgi:hypothetical protein
MILKVLLKIISKYSHNIVKVLFKPSVIVYNAVAIREISRGGKQKIDYSVIFHGQAVKYDGFLVFSFRHNICEKHSLN